MELEGSLPLSQKSAVSSYPESVHCSSHLYGQLPPIWILSSYLCLELVANFFLSTFRWNFALFFSSVGHMLPRLWLNHPWWKAQIVKLVIMQFSIVTSSLHFSTCLIRHLEGMGGTSGWVTIIQYQLLSVLSCAMRECFVQWIPVTSASCSPASVVSGSGYVKVELTVIIRVLSKWCWSHPW
jgi:hypothetical protein